MVSSWVMAQDRYAVFYKYKPQETFNLSNPQDYLTQEALARRQKENVSLDSLDLPVSEKYVTAIEPLTEYILYQSKWFNASIAVLDQEAVKTLEQFDFVERVEFIAPGFTPRPDARLRKKILASVTLTSCSDENKRTLRINETPYDFQNELLGIPLMHEESFRGQGVTIAVFDAGFPGVNTDPAFAHLLANGQLIGNKHIVQPWVADVFSSNQHGTNVLSLIAADDPELLLAGAPDANFILALTEDASTEYRIEEYNWVRAAEYADSLGTDIIQSSVGYFDFDDPSMTYTQADMDGKTAVISQGAQIASDKGILVINSSGNYGAGESSLVAPADAAGVLAIGATTSDLEVAGFSSRGPTADGRLKPDLATFGSGVALLRSNGSLGFANGTSFSSPQITALAAGLMQARPEWTKEELIENLKRSASQADNPDNLLGYGIPNFYRAYYGEILDVETPLEELEWKVYPNPLLGDELSISVGNELTTQITLVDMTGRVVLYTELQRSSVREPYQLSMRNINPGLYVLKALEGRTPRQVKIFRK
ncbi:S8 family serine peptidase [Algoriphagus namhaensis]